MSTDSQQNQASQEQNQEQKASDKEINFARVRKQLEEERAARMAVEERAKELERLFHEKQKHDVDDEGSDEPYVDHRRLEKRIAKFEQKSKQETQQEIKNAVDRALSEERKNQWLKANSDFYEIMGHAQTFADRDPELAETILQMPDNFERQKLVYKNIKALNLHKKEDPKSNVQDKIDQNRRSPYYQPSGIGTAPYAGFSIGKEVSEVEGQAAYKKLQELKSRLRI